MRKLQRANDDLTSTLRDSGLREAELSAEVGRLRNALATRRAEQPGGSGPWLPVSLAIFGLVVALVALGWRRRRRTRFRDVPVTVEAYEEVEPPRVESFR